MYIDFVCNPSPTFKYIYILQLHMIRVWRQRDHLTFGITCTFVIKTKFAYTKRDETYIACG